MIIGRLNQTDGATLHVQPIGVWSEDSSLKHKMSQNYMYLGLFLGYVLFLAIPTSASSSPGKIK